MSKKKKKEYTVNDLLEEFFPETEEISEEDAAGEDVEIVTETLEEDTAAETNENDGNDGNAPDISDKNDGEENTGETASKDKTETDGNGAEMNEGTDFLKSETVGNEVETADISKNNDVSDSAEDVNQKFIVRLLGGIFPRKGDSVWEAIRKIVFLAAVIVFVGAGIMLISTLVQSRQAVHDKMEVQSAVESILETTVATTIDTNGNVITIPPTKEEIAEQNLNLAEFFKENAPDYKGFLELEGCDIQEPVVQTDDNKYYLTHTYYGGTNKAGAVFMDYRCTFSEEYVSPNIVIYGHNQEDGTMFGNLKRYKQNVKFYAENPVVKLSSESETFEYLIYGFFVTNALEKQDSNGVVFHYHDYIETLEDENTFNWYMTMIGERNQIVSPVDVQYGDKLLCLSTCSNEFSNSRFVIFARQLREGESVSDYDFSKTYLNPYAKGVDWEAILSGETSESEESEDETSEETTEDVEIKVFIEDASETTVPEETEKTEKTRRTRKPRRKKTEISETTTTLDATWAQSMLEEMGISVSDSSETETGVSETGSLETETGSGEIQTGSGETTAETAPPENSGEEQNTETATTS